MHESIVPLKSEGELFKKILGEKWLNLHPDIRRRFDKNPTPGNPLKYEGKLEELNCSFWGKMLACLTWPLIKGALLPFCAIDVPVNIQVYSQEGCPFIFKERIYKIPGRTPVMFTSYMKEGEKGEALEYVGAGLGMRLRVFEKDSNLHFESDGYFLDIGICRIPLPEVFSPGHTYLMHINENENGFRIRIDIKHKLFGKMFVQAGLFNEMKS